MVAGRGRLEKGQGVCYRSNGVGERQPAGIDSMGKLIRCGILILLGTVATSCSNLHDTDIKPNEDWAYIPANDDNKPDTWLDLSLYLDNELIVRANIPLVKIQASRVGVRYPFASYIADGTNTCTMLDASISEIDRDGIYISFKYSGANVRSKAGFDIVRERLLIPYTVYSRGQTNRISYIARWKK